MPKGYPRLTCKRCEKPATEVGPLSARGKCSSCATAFIAANHIGLVRRTGPFYDHWRLRTIEALTNPYRTMPREREVHTNHV